MSTPANFARWVSRNRWRIYLLFILLMVLPIAFFAYSVGQVVRHRTETQADTESTQIARVSAALAEEHFRESIAFLESFATRRTFRQAWTQGNLDLVGWHLKQASGLRPDFAFVSVYDIDGTMRADQTAIAPYPLVVAVVVPVKNDAGKPIGILMAPYALDTMSRRLVETKVEGAWTISLVDQNGNLSARPNIDSFARAVDLSGYEPVKQVRAGRAGNGIFEWDGTTFFARYEPVNAYGWGVLVEQPSAALHQAVWALERWNGGYGYLGWRFWLSA